MLRSLRKCGIWRRKGAEDGEWLIENGGLDILFKRSKLKALKNNKKRTYSLILDTETGSIINVAYTSQYFSAEVFNTKTEQNKTKQTNRCFFFC